MVQNDANVHIEPSEDIYIKKVDITTPDAVNLIIAEYNALREEILKLTDIQYQIAALALIAPGTLITIGFQLKNATMIILIYPIFALFLAACWLNNAHGIYRLGLYIRKRIEPKVGEENIGWETFSRQTPMDHYHLGFWGYRAIFIGTAVLAILAALSIATYNWIVIVSLVIAIGCTLANAALLLCWAEPRA